jgi:tripartite-type tricarboxylate transporter receptor subunit TctC
MKRAARWAALAVFTLAAASAFAQDFPKAPVRLIVPFAPGGPTDMMARLVSQKLQDAWGQSVIVDYRAGAGTLVGVTAVAKSPPDGYTLGIVPAAYTINPVLRKSMPYDTLRDLTGVTQIVATHLVIVANPDAPFNNVAELVAYAKRNPGKLSYGSPGTGGTSHLAGELLNRTAGIDMLHIPYKGSVPAQSDVIGGRVPLMIDASSSALPFVKAGRLKVIATTGPRRLPGNEQYPNVAETYPGYEVTGLLGLIAPKGVPRAVLQKIAADAARGLRSPDAKKQIEDTGSETIGSTHEQFDAVIQNEMTKWAKVIREAKIEAE